MNEIGCKSFTHANHFTSISLHLVARWFQAAPYTVSTPGIQGETVTIQTLHTMADIKWLRLLLYLWLQCDVTEEEKTACSPVDNG